MGVTVMGFVEHFGPWNFTTIGMLILTLFFRNAKVKPLLNPHCAKHKPWSDEYFKCVVQNNAITVYHPVGTCKMGSKVDPMAVVDSELKVLGIGNLRVIDASVMPRIIGGNTNAATVMIGEKGADMIIKDYPSFDIKQNENKEELWMKVMTQILCNQ